jgi:hypothetical protein
MGKRRTKRGNLWETGYTRSRESQRQEKDKETNIKETEIEETELGQKGKIMKRGN